jgi:hypothetical protein
MELRAFPGKVDTGFPIGNATSIESRALSGHDPCNFRVNLIGKRSSGRLGWIAQPFFPFSANEANFRERSDRAKP